MYTHGCHHPYPAGRISLPLVTPNLHAMSEAILKKTTLAHLEAIDADIRALNDEKIRLILRSLDRKLGPADLEKMLGWDLILVSVPDKQMRIQLNRLCPYVPNLKFVLDTDNDAYTFTMGKKGRRVHKER